MSFENQFAKLHPLIYAELLQEKDGPHHDEEWETLLLNQWEEALELLPDEHHGLFTSLRKGQHEVFNQGMQNILNAPKIDLDNCFGSFYFWIDANPLSPAQTYMTPEIRNWFWRVIEKHADSYAQKVRWAIRTHQPFTIISELLSSVESIEEIEIKKMNFFTLLHESCVNPHLPTIELLLTKDADINIHDQNSSTPLDLVCMRNHHEALLLLLRYSPSFENLLSALDSVPSYFPTIRTTLLNFLCLHYLNNDLAMNTLEKELPALLQKYPVAFNFALSLNTDYPCESLRKILGNLRLPAVTLGTLNQWWRNLQFFSPNVLRQNPTLLVPPPLLDTPSHSKKTRRR